MGGFIRISIFLQNIDEGFGLGDSTPNKNPGQDVYNMDFITGQASMITTSMKYCIYTHRYMYYVCTGHSILFSSKPSGSSFSATHTHSFPGWLLQGLQPFSQSHPASKARGVDEKPSSLGLLPRAPRWQPGSPPPGTICASGAWPRRRVFPGKANLVPSSKGMKWDDSWQDMEQGFFMLGGSRHQLSESEAERLMRWAQLGGGGAGGPDGPWEIL